MTVVVATSAAVAVVMIEAIVPSVQIVPRARMAYQPSRVSQEVIALLASHVSLEPIAQPVNRANRVQRD